MFGGHFCRLHKSKNKRKHKIMIILCVGDKHTVSGTFPQHFPVRSWGNNGPLAWTWSCPGDTHFLILNLEIIAFDNFLYAE